MRILLFSTLFPNAAMPSHGVFVANRLEAFRKKYDADVKVVAPVPWFPFRHDVFGAYADWARAPAQEKRGDIEVFHPRFFVPPKTAMGFAPGALTRCFRKSVRKLIDDGWDFDLIDAHYFYPDGVAAARIARELGKPLVITARGTDVNLLPEYPGPRRAILKAANRADAIIAVASALKDALGETGAQKEKITVLRNGVDLNLFKETDRETARRALGLSGLVLASVGHLIERKGHDLAIRALRDLPEATLIIAGEGPARKTLTALAESLGLADRVRFLGRVPHEELAGVYSAADILVLASSREGWPNVLLEAMACGTPCVAADVWGTGEVIRSPDAGRLAEERTPSAIAGAIRSLLQNPPGRRTVRSYAQAHSWDETADGMAAVFKDFSEKSGARKSVKVSPVEFPKDDYRPKLIVTVDTEEEFDWNAFDKVDYAVGNVEGVERFQGLCSEQGVKPLYFLTWPILNDETSAKYFQGLKQSVAADCGLHLHQWATPSISSRWGEFKGAFYSFQKNLPRGAHREKLRSLAQAYERVFEETARSHRAGRYGIAPEDYELLAEIGVEYDFSPSAGFDFSDCGGPDFSGMSNRPFSIECGQGRIFVTPVSGAKAIRHTKLFVSQEGQAPGFPSYRKSYSRNLTIPLRLSPEGAALADLKALTKRLAADKTPVLTYTLHSTSLTPGANDYVACTADVDRLLETTAAYFDWFCNDLGGDLLSLDGLKPLYGA